MRACETPRDALITIRLGSRRTCIDTKSSLTILTTQNVLTESVERTSDARLSRKVRTTCIDTAQIPNVGFSCCDVNELLVLNAACFQMLSNVFCILSKLIRSNET